MCNFWAQNGPFALSKFFLVQTNFITFIYLLALFIVQNLQKVVRMPHFGLKMVHLPLICPFAKFKEKNNESIPTKLTERQKDGQKDRHILFSGQGRGSKKSPVKNRTACKY